MYIRRKTNSKKMQYRLNFPKIRNLLNNLTPIKKVKMAEINKINKAKLATIPYILIFIAGEKYGEEK